MGLTKQEFFFQSQEEWEEKIVNDQQEKEEILQYTRGIVNQLNKPLTEEEKENQELLQIIDSFDNVTPTKMAENLPQELETIIPSILTKITPLEAEYLKLHFINQHKKEFFLTLSNLEKNKRTPCPTCHTNVGTYYKTLSKGHIVFLARLQELWKSGKKYNHYDEVLTYVKLKTSFNPTDYTKLEYFKLISPMPKVKGDGNSSGMFCISQRGVRFLDGAYRIPKYVLQHSDKTVIEESQELVGVYDIYKNFNYEKLINKENV